MRETTGRNTCGSQRGARRLAAALCGAIALAGCGGATARHRPAAAPTDASVTVSVSGSGTVGAAGISCPGACVAGYPPPAVALVGFGQSIEAGTGATNPSTDSWMALLAAQLHVRNLNFGVPSAVAAYPDGGADAGGWAHVLHDDLPGKTLGRAPLKLDYAVMFGLNDLAVLGGPDHLGPFAQAMDTILARLDAVAVREDSDPSVIPGAGWRSRPTDGTLGSGKTMLQPAAPGDALTIDVPATFAGGTVALGFTVGAGRSQPSGAVAYRVRVDGGASRPFVIDGPTMVTPELKGSGGFIGVVDRLGGLAPGRHTLSVTLASSTGSLTSFFDYWEAEAPPALARPIVLPLQYDVTATGFQNYRSFPYIPDDRAVAALNAEIRRIAAAFGPNVRTVDLTLHERLPNYIADQLHPSDAGHRLIDQEVLPAFRSILLHATPAAGWRLASWHGANCRGTSCVVPPGGKHEVRVSFVRAAAG